MVGEFELIAKAFAPLTSGDPLTYNLANDAALFDAPEGQRAVLTIDAMVAGVHFLERDPPETVAKKLLRVNLSDLNAMGARPTGYLLSTCLSEKHRATWVESFAQGLADDQARYGVHLLGGDTTSTPGPTTLSLTAIGLIGKDQVPHERSTAHEGDLICVTGTLGDAAAGLMILNGLLSFPDSDGLVNAYRTPEPPMGLGEKLLGHASACLDVSDGLLADLGHIASGSGLKAVVRAMDLPLSDALSEVIADDPGLLELALTGGDDYQLLFTLPPSELEGLQTEVEGLSVIGEMQAGTGVTALDGQGEPLEIAAGGWTHF